MDIFLIALGIGALLYGLHRAALYAESRGWFFYKTRPPRVRSLGMFEEIFEPSVEHRVVEETSESIRADQDEDGLSLP